MGAAAFALALGCSSSTVNDAGGGASSGGASGAGGSTSGGASSGGASSGGASTDAATGGASGYVWCAAATECAELCGTLQPWCAGGLCRCNPPAPCEKGTEAGCPQGMQCAGKSCLPIGPVPEGETCADPGALCELGTLCYSPDPPPATGWDFRCRRLCNPAAPPPDCGCVAAGWCSK